MRFLEQGFHFYTRNNPVDESIDSCNGRFLFAIPDIDVDRARNVAGMCRLISKYLVDKTLPGFPYALWYDEQARFDEFTGELMMPNGVGLNCSTFVIAVFRSCRIRFIDFAGWPQREQDAEAHEKLVSILKTWRDKGRATNAHVDRVINEIGCVRARPEEVAGVCLLVLPGSYPDAEEAGKAVLAELEN